MESFRQHRSPTADSFLGLFSHPPPPSSAADVSSFGGADELHEDDIFWTGTDSSEPNHPFQNHMSIPNPNPNPSSSFALPGHRRLPERNFGILAALMDEEKNHIQRKSLASSSSSGSASPRMIPAVPKPKMEYAAMSVPGGKMYHQSAPMNVPLMPPRSGRGGWAEIDGDVMGDEEVEDEEMLPPHEIVARAASKESPLTTFSMLEGVGRTLKGRDLRRVRNAVWRQTGFLE